MLTRLTMLVALSLPVLAFAEARELEGAVGLNDHHAGRKLDRFSFGTGFPKAQ